MNPAGQPAQQASSQPNGQQQPAQRWVQPNDMDTLPLSEEEKNKYKAGLINLYKAVQNAQAGSPQQAEAQRKIRDFSTQLMAKCQSIMAQQRAASGSTQALHGPATTQAGFDQTMAASAGMSATTAGGQPGSAPAMVGAANVQGQQPQTGNRAPAPVISPAVRTHANEIVTQAPQNIVDEGPESVAKWLSQRREIYATAVVKTQHASNVMKEASSKIAAMQANGGPDAQKMVSLAENRRVQARQAYAQAKSQVDQIRLEQTTLKSARAGNRGPSEAPANPAGQVGGQQAGSAGEAPKVQPAGAPVAGTNPQAGQQPLQASPVNAAQAQPVPPQQIKTEPGMSQAHVPPAVNTAIASAANAGMPSAGTPTQRMPPTPSQIAAPNMALSHSAALDRANKAKEQKEQMNPNPLQGTPQGQLGTPSSAGVMGSTATQQPYSHAHPGANQHPQASITSKLPIAKVLPEKASMAPQPVSTSVGGVAAGRPTYTGGGGTAGGVTGQPILPKIPQVQLEGEGDRVMNRKKLDDLIRQVCGGQSEGQEGNSLTPDVEDAVLTMADTFVDKLLHSACSVAKARGSKVLEIRDIQLVLERTFNIRIPGYATDELRAVRRIQPAVGWLTKISAIQAAKVTGNKEF